jgi:4-amino-4-deoxy-L-arabinose transferase-like glycosyltransferase
MNERQARTFLLLSFGKLREVKIDLVVVAFIVAGFVLVAAQRLETAPLPDTDESMTLQVPYEMIYRGKLALPMYRYLGGNIENAWHSYTPVFFLLLSGFLKLFGWGLAQGRAFNLLTAALVLLLVHLVGRRLFDWRVGLAAVVLLVSDPTFLDRSRLVRNDYAGAMFALLAFYLYEVAERRKQGRVYVAAGLAAGAGVMCHTNVLYIIAAIGMLMVLRHGWRVIREKSVYQFAAGSAAVIAYEIIFDLVDWKNFVLQNRQDEMHFSVLDGWGWWTNLRGEFTRYASWYDGYLKIGAPLKLLHVFLWLSSAGLVYLLVRVALQVRRGNVVDEPRARLLIATLVIVLFLAVITQRKVILYVIHLAPWFALAAGVMLRDGLELVGRLRMAAWPRAKWAYAVMVTAIACAVGLYGFHLARQTRIYLRAVNDPQRATFKELAGVLRAVVPEDVCPVSIKQGVLWLAFPEKDYCFAAIEDRMRAGLDIKGNQYALIASGRRNKKEGKLLRELTEGAKLIARLRRTAWGTLSVYYTGANPAYLSLAPAHYLFFGRERGYVSENEIEAAREVWTATAEDMIQSASGENQFASSGGFTIQQSSDATGAAKLGAIHLKPATVYQLILDTGNQRARWEIVVTDEETSAVIYDGKLEAHDEAQRFADLFKTKTSGRILVSLHPAGQESEGSITVSRVSLREVAPVFRAAPN